MRKLYFICLLSLIARLSLAQTPNLNERVKALEEHLQFMDQGLTKTIHDLIHGGVHGGFNTFYAHIDTKLARASREEVYGFGALHLTPPNFTR